MTPSTFIAAPRSITHPSNYRPAAAAGLEFGSTAELYAAHDQAILQHQERLVDRALEGGLDKESFLRSAGHLESFESLRADLRGNGGLSRREKAILLGEMKKLAGKMQALPQYQTEPREAVDADALGLLFDELREGAVHKHDAVEELHWRSNLRYGQVVAQRHGPIYGEERGKLRAALAKEIETSAPGPAPSGQPIYHAQSVELVRKGMEIFPELDRNGDQVVDRTEARALLSRFEKLGLSAPEAATLYSRQAVLAEVVEPGQASFEKLALEDLEALLPENGDADPQPRVATALNLLGARLADQERRTLVANMPLHSGPDGPNGSRVSQGLEGSCWFLGALPAIDSESLAGILTPEGDHFRMNFADGSSEKVSPLNDAERRVYSRGDGAWSGLMEKGVAQKLEREGIDIKGGLPQDALHLLTGRDAVVSFLNAKPLGGVDYRDQENLGQLLQTTLEAGGAVFTQVNSADFDPQVSLISDSRHAYTITGYDPETRLVDLRNPWGQGEKADRDGVDDGNFQLSLTEVAATFSLVITEKSS